MATMRVYIRDVTCKNLYFKMLCCKTRRDTIKNEKLKRYLGITPI